MSKTYGFISVATFLFFSEYSPKSRYLYSVSSLLRRACRAKLESTTRAQSGTHIRREFLLPYGVIHTATVRCKRRRFDSTHFGHQTSTLGAARFGHLDSITISRLKNKKKRKKKIEKKEIKMQLSAHALFY